MSKEIQDNSCGYRTTTSEWDRGDIHFSYTEPASPEDWEIALDQLDHEEALIAPARGLHHAMSSLQFEIVRRRYSKVRQRVDEAMKRCDEGEADRASQIDCDQANGVLKDIAKKMNIAA